MKRESRDLGQCQIEGCSSTAIYSMFRTRKTKVWLNVCHPCCLITEAENIALSEIIGKASVCPDEGVRFTSIMAREG